MNHSEGEWQPVAGGVWRLVAEPDAVTIGLIAGETGAVLVDTGSTPAQGRELAAKVAEVTDKPLAGVVITHADRDHWFGLAGIEGVTAYGHESLAERVSDAETLAEAESLGVAVDELRVPERLFSVAAAIDLGGVVVELLHLGAAHTEGDVLVNVPSAGVLFTGDLIEEPAPWFGPRSSPRGWPEVLNMVLGMVRPDTVIVPGHGAVVDLDFLVRQLAALASLPPEAERLVRSGVRLERAEAEGEWPFDWARVEAGVRTAYGELAADGVRTRLPLAGDH
ncbi:glyoxylase-like metal-dependent hydrolase (beta-lactamase superfamily II) [Propionibacteriaceae bacterium ES.041]|uniref:MBL fold metallo-hydrolase n=1 Tax=Enemella evansiae TaxID=2016499 RepID=UPI000B9753EB|nr:MBL fold metallo-hydrolase [Enemella evansiae]OYN93409.1 MBL fold metallo-hydrolase [Enemella evansiae]PFG66568.1 glyoxylase-like metal-dependent hydrolase (beta-lactamase superfamily II) [Propionibacteriaceae bacterium ES.041]